ncbi:hypothetical protein TNCV_903801 [Trichonephila clavipes]|nr:hypothetical protein TNCV_903801 [Trichonephila clavipes]
MQMTVRFGSVPFQFGDNTLGVISEASCFSSPYTNLTRGFASRLLFRVPHCHEGTIHLQASMPSPGFKPRPYGTSVSVTNCTG